MKHLHTRFTLSALSLLTASLIAACGGGGTTTSPTTLAGKVIDGYIKGATVCLDVNSNMVCDSGEPSDTTKDGGVYSLVAPVGVNLSTTHLLVNVPTTATDSDGPIKAAYKMMAPASMPSVITPLTTAVSAQMLNNNQTVAQARLSVRGNMSLPVDFDFAKDYLAPSTLDTAAHNLARVSAAVLADKVGTATPTSSNLGTALTQMSSLASSAYAGTATDADNQVTEVLGLSGSTGTCTDSVSTQCLSFAANSLALNAWDGNIVSSLTTDPSDSTNSVGKLIKAANSAGNIGVVVDTSGAGSWKLGTSTAITSSNKNISIRVFSPGVGRTIAMKITGVGVTSTTQLLTKNTTRANKWETLTFTFNTPTDFDQISFFPAFTNDTTTQNTSTETYYFDELKYPAPPLRPASLAFSTGFASATRTVEGGGFGGYSGSNLDGWNCSGDPAWCGSGSATVSNTTTAANSNFYYYYRTPTPSSGQYEGIFVLAPGVTSLSASANTAGLQLTNQTSMNFTLGQNPEWFASADKNFAVMLTLGKYYNVNGDACNPKLLKIMTPTASDPTNYSTSLSGFTLTQNCGVGTMTVSSALSSFPISQIDFQADSGAASVSAGGMTSGANTTVPSNGVYATTIVLKGGITFN